MPCETNDDCRTSSAGRLCGNVATRIENGNVVPVKACVERLENEGDTAMRSKRLAPRPMSGCRDPLQAFPAQTASQLFALEVDQASCGKLCASDADCTQSLPRVLAPVCSLGVLQSVTTPGVCTTRRAGKGAMCSLSSVIEICDVEQTPNMICVNLNLSESHANDPRGPYGYCLEICDMMNPTCVTSNDPVLQSTCEFGLFTSPDIGLCDDNCSAFPDNCTGRGSPPPSPPQSAAQRGMSCMPFGQLSGSATDINLCLDVAQTEPLFPPWDFSNIPPMACMEDVHRCPDGAICLQVDLGTGNQDSVCIFGCDTTTGTTSCAQAPFQNCSNVFGTTQGVCTPMP